MELSLRGERLSAKLRAGLLFLRRDLQSHKLILEGDLFREYIAAAPQWLKSAFCLIEFSEKVDRFGLTGFFIDTGWWQVEETEKALSFAGAAGAREVYKLARESFSAGLDADLMDRSLLMSITRDSLHKLLVAHESEVDEWLVVLSRYGSIVGVEHLDKIIEQSLVRTLPYFKAKVVSPYSVRGSVKDSVRDGVKAS